MRRAGCDPHKSGLGGLALLLGAFLFAILPLAAQQGPINPRIPPPPPPPEESAPPPAPKPAPPATSQPAPPPQPPEPAPPPPTLPATVSIPSGTRINVVLDTPLSTRISRQGQIVTFRTSDSLPVGDQLEIPPETAFTGSVVEVRRPGHFGKPGALRVKVDRVNLSTGATQEVIARIDSPDFKGQGRASADSNRTTDLYSLAAYTLEGTLIGTQIHGGKGAAIGAGAGAAVAILIMMSRRGADVYLEPGMPFVVVLDRAVQLPGKEIYAAQQSYAREHSVNSGSSSSAADSTEAEGETRGDPGRPKLKRRPKPPLP